MLSEVVGKTGASVTRSVTSPSRVWDWSKKVAQPSFPFPGRTRCTTGPLYRQSASVAFAMNSMKRPNSVSLDVIRIGVLSHGANESLRQGSKVAGQQRSKIYNPWGRAALRQSRILLANTLDNRRDCRLVTSSPPRTK